MDQVSDAKLHRALERPENIRVELTLKKAAGMYLRHGPDVAEVFSQPRVCQEAIGRGLTPGWSLDLTMKDPATGQRWDLSDKKTQDRVRRLIRDTEPYCIIGSPPCTPFSLLQELGRARRDPQIMKKELEDAKGHIRFCMEIYRTQLKARRHFIHEHPETPRAWKMPEVIDIMMQPEVDSTVLHMCAFGMKATDGEGTALVKKPTRIMSSSEEVMKRISRRCSNENGECCKHRHV